MSVVPSSAGHTHNAEVIFFFELYAFIILTSTLAEVIYGEKN